MSYVTDATHAAVTVEAAALTPPATAPQSNHEADNKQDQQKQQNVSAQDVQKIADSMNQQLQSVGTELSFTVDKDTDKMVMKVIDSKTHDVIRQIPPEDALKLASKLKKLMGVLVDRKS